MQNKYEVIADGELWKVTDILQINLKYILCFSDNVIPSCYKSFKNEKKEIWWFRLKLVCNTVSNFYYIPIPMYLKGNDYRH